MWYKLFKYGLFRPAVKLSSRPWITGEENLPASGGAILACNHLSAGDTFVLPVMVSRTVIFPAKAELFTGEHGLKSKIVARFLKLVGQVPMDRGGGRASAEGLRPVIEVLHRGELVGIYPEGTRSPDGRLYKGKTGVARMALEAGVPVIPIGMVGTDITKNRLGLPRMERPGVVIGKPLDFSGLVDNKKDLKTLRWVTDQVMAGIQELTGQTYVDVYASRVKHGDLLGADVTDRILERPGQNTPAPEPRP